MLRRFLRILTTVLLYTFQVEHSLLLLNISKMLSSILDGQSQKAPPMHEGVGHFSLVLCKLSLFKKFGDTQGQTNSSRAKTDPSGQKNWRH